MSLLCTFPGRYGDLLWALPAVRAISQAAGEPVALQIAGEFASLAPILRAPYLGVIIHDSRWALTPPNEWQAPDLATVPHEPEDGPPYQYDRVVHLGYRGWPDQPLPQYVYAQTRREYPDLALAPLDLETPWLTAPPSSFPSDRRYRNRVACGFSDCWVELKMGVLLNLCSRVRNGFPAKYSVYYPEGSRWEEWAKVTYSHLYGWGPYSWEHTATAIREAAIFFGDCSALHVLACALGKRVVLLEPMEARWNPIFYPYGTDGPRVTLVKGNDGLPTFDARHCADVIHATLADVLETEPWEVRERRRGR